MHYHALNMARAACLRLRGNAADVAPGSGHVVRIPIPEHLDASALDEFAMLVRYLPRQEEAA